MGQSSQAKQKEPHAVLDLGIREEDESEVKAFRSLFMRGDDVCVSVVSVG